MSSLESIRTGKTCLLADSCLMVGCKLGMNYFPDMETFVLSAAPLGISLISNNTQGMQQGVLSFHQNPQRHVLSILMVPYIHKTCRNVIYLSEFCVVNQLNQERLNGVRDKKEKELSLRNKAKAVGCTYRALPLNSCTRVRNLDL